MTGTSSLKRFHEDTLTQLCMHYALAGQWEVAYSYALQTIAARKSHGGTLITFDFYRHYETEALVRAGQERQAREAVNQLGEGLGPYRRFRIPYLPSLAVLPVRHARTEQTTPSVHET